MRLVEHLSQEEKGSHQLLHIFCKRIIISNLSSLLPLPKVVIQGVI